MSKLGSSGNSGKWFIPAKEESELISKIEGVSLVG
jgi:hypothetical protein